MSQFLVTVPSHRRPHAVEGPLTEEFGDRIIWVVNDRKDAKDYRSAGAHNIVETNKSWPHNRNVCVGLSLKEGLYNLQLDDDLRGIYRSWHEQSQIEHCTSVSFESVADEVLAYMHIAKTPLGGVQANRSAYFSKQRIHVWGYIIGAFMVIDPRIRETFTMPFKQDWEITCKVLHRHGCVVRLDYYIMDVLYFAGAGGLHQYRTDETSRKASNKLMREYPHIVRPHKTRAYDIGVYHTIRTMPTHAKETYAVLNEAFAIANG